MNLATHWKEDPDGVERTDLGALVRVSREEFEAIQRVAAADGLEPDVWLGRKLRPAAADLLAFSGPGWGHEVDKS